MQTRFQTTNARKFSRSLSSDVHIVRGDFDDESVKGADSKVVTVGQFRIGLCNGHQIIPWNDPRVCFYTIFHPQSTKID